MVKSNPMVSRKKNKSQGLLLAGPKAARKSRDVDRMIPKREKCSVCWFSPLLSGFIFIYCVVVKIC